jgi:RNA polymerase sigma-70 factor, ECF subfamily
MLVQARMEAAGPIPISSASVEALFREHHDLVYRAAYRVTGNAADAEDVLQNVFLRLVRRGPGDVVSAASYLYRAAVNAALDVMRSRQTAQALSIDDEVPELAGNPSDAPDRAHDARQVAEWVRNTVARLSPMAAEIFVLRFYEGKENPEIAEIVGTTTGTVAVTLHRTRARLERELRTYMGETR